MPAFESRVRLASTFFWYTHLLFSNKAVADGAVSSYIAPLVTSRTSKFTYGVECIRAYDPSLSDHRERERKKFKVPSGIAMLPDAFRSILEKVFISYRFYRLLILFPTVIGSPGRGAARVSIFFYCRTKLSLRNEHCTRVHSCIQGRSF